MTGAIMGKVVQVLILALRGGGRYVTPELQLRGGTGAPGVGRTSYHTAVKETCGLALAVAKLKYFHRSVQRSV